MLNYFSIYSLEKETLGHSFISVEKMVRLILKKAKQNRPIL